MKPGHKYKSGRYKGECMRESVATATGIPKTELPYIDPYKIPAIIWHFEWDKLLAEHGLKKKEFHPNGINEPEGFWIAVVPNDAETDHAVVMRGRKLWHDPALTRKQRPHAFITGIELVPIDN